MTQKPTNSGQLTFWEHLDQLRGSIIRILVAVVALGFVAFFFKEQLFAVLLAPKQQGFITYRLFVRITGASTGVRLVGGGYVMFMLGVALNYFVIFPLTFRFLGTYQVSTDVPNLISLESYMSTLLMLSLVMGVMFEMPVVAWLLARMGFVSAGFMRRYRRHAVVAILVVAAIITPTADAFTLSVVALPIYLLYELGIIIAAKAEKKRVE